ncbi:Glutamyl-tRNA(Gln) amidotransferase subunit A [Camellia lanceoleosa]|uniref:Glutamyl-tRNA(Gln) amidotransferase subunit A n=1 Tax=Camellia lanceoleosa TaxID=1840588 RepID=A0ACC0HTF2_9ERIC|nr:Glutamyl-tRNA(Gln) amidotransferase subunit A [Camellia lanceoleosa]
MGVKGFNQPIIKSNQKLVASTNGGLHNPSCLVFNPHWANEQAQDLRKKFNIPSLSGVQRPKIEEDIAFMTVLELGQLIKTKQITSEELTGIFLKRLKRLKSAGAVLVAKLVTGSLAYDDIWFGGRTRNPWNIEEYSTGSSAGPAACTSAGMVPFAIGSETAGSITYPAACCGVTALRPTFGSVGRTAVMSISESLDKLGPFCRSAVDCTVVLDAIRGKDPDDLSSRNISLDDPFLVDIAKLTVGYLDDAEMEVVHVLRSNGVNMVPFKLNYSVDSVQGIMNFTMDVDMLSHFDEWQRSRQDDNYEAQDQWPVELCRARMVPAVDYLQAQRARGKLITEGKESFTVDAFVGNATDWEKVCMGNLVGMPVIVVPTGFKMISNPPPSNHTRRRTTITAGIYSPPEHDHIVALETACYTGGYSVDDFMEYIQG